jgi:hypothetical protein
VLFTGQYPSLHEVTDTDGLTDTDSLTKAATDPAMHFLDPDTVPTMESLPPPSMVLPPRSRPSPALETSYPVSELPAHTPKRCE